MGLVAAALSASAGCGGGEPPASTDVAREVETMLRASARSWNAGDLEGFLDDYAAGRGLTFVSGAGVVRGLDSVRARYRRTYWAPGAERDSLRFEDVEVRPLGPRHALAVGRYVLYGSAPADVRGTGRFSLVLEKGDEGAWKILHDHTSASPDGGG